MAAKVVPFPKVVGHSVNEVEALIRKWLEQMGEGTELTEHVVKNMMVFIEQYATKMFEPVFNLAVPPNLSKEAADALVASIEEGMDGVAIQVQEIINRIIVERFFLEIEIFYQRHPLKGNKNTI